MRKIDYTKPIAHKSCGKAEVIGKDGEWTVVKLVNYKGSNPFYAYDDYGRSRENLGMVFLVNVPVTHKRWVVLFRGGDNTLRATCYREQPTSYDLRVYNDLVAIKEVTFEEGEGLA